jgi:hypothetical protein
VSCAMTGAAARRSVSAAADKLIRPFMWDSVAWMGLCSP